MGSFIQAHLSKVTGMVSGGDRVRFWGTVRMLANVAGLWRFLRCSGRSLEVAAGQGRPMVYLSSPGERKEDVAREIQKLDRVKEGLICVLTSVEPCWSFDIRSNRQSGKLELVHAYRKCQHL